MSQTVATFATIFFSMILVNNYVLVQFLGICPFLGVSKSWIPPLVWARLLLQLW